MEAEGLGGLSLPRASSSSSRRGKDDGENGKWGSLGIDALDGEDEDKEDVGTSTLSVGANDGKAAKVDTVRGNATSCGCEGLHVKCDVMDG